LAAATAPPAAAWLRPPRRDPARWKEWRLPAHAHLNVPLDARSRPPFVHPEEKNDR
jgi:hypothetical protein